MYDLYTFIFYLSQTRKFKRRLAKTAVFECGVLYKSENKFSVMKLFVLSQGGLDSNVTSK